MTIKLIRILLALAFAAYGPILAQSPERSVRGQTLSSSDLPHISIKLQRKFKYIGRLSFDIGKMASGQRFVFVDAGARKNVKRLFIAQFESILPTSDEIYRYNFEGAEKIAGHLFRQNPYAFSVAESTKENPTGESAKTAEFLNGLGYRFEDEWMSWRMLTVPGETRKHELILFYIENVSSSGKRLSEFYKDDEMTDVWRKISVELAVRAKDTITINHGPPSS